MINFTNKLGIYKCEGKALENYKKMQCRPAYLRYKRKLRRMSAHNDLPFVSPIPFEDFCSLMIAEQRQASLF
ncbi:hypothetical protein KAJ61_05780 [Candidatus Parcubacteria bacterium]|nr:hypothetical protein [Candidatus Parcubacteria bacterium]